MTRLKHNKEVGRDAHFFLVYYGLVTQVDYNFTGVKCTAGHEERVYYPGQYTTAQQCDASGYKPRSTYGSQKKSYIFQKIIK
jgi:hypothetical protein